MDNINLTDEEETLEELQRKFNRRIKLNKKRKGKGIHIPHNDHANGSTAKANHRGIARKFKRVGHMEGEV